MVLPLATSPFQLPQLYRWLLISNFEERWYLKYIGIVLLLFPSVSYFFLRIDPDSTAETKSAVLTSITGINIVWLVFSAIVAFAYLLLHTRYFTRAREVEIFSPLHLGDTARVWQIPVKYDKMYSLIIRLFVAYCLYEIQYTSRLYQTPSFSLGYKCWGVLVALGWAYFFMVCMAIYLYVMTLMLHLKYAIKEWMFQIRRGSRNGHERFVLSVRDSTQHFTFDNLDTSIYPQHSAVPPRYFINHPPPYDFEEMAQEYEVYYRVCRKFARWWATLIACVFTMITFRLPMSVLLLFRRGQLNEIPIFGLLVVLWVWMLYLICYLNDENKHFRELFYKYHITRDTETIERFERVNEIKPLGMNLYGFVFTFEYTAQTLMIVFNVVLPVLFALASEKLV